MQIRDRIKELRRVRASELRQNPKNWRTHPQAQQDALRGILAEIGYADALLARELPDGSLELIDGHLRQALDPEQTVPVLVLDVDEAEAAKLLVTLDPLAAMAEANQEVLNDLIEKVNTEDAALRKLLDSLSTIQEPRLTAEEVGEDSEKLKAFKEARAKSREAGNDKGEVNFWVCLVFQSFDQKHEFLGQLNGTRVLYGMYADGEAFADAVGVPVTKNERKRMTSPLDRALSELVIESS